MMKKIEWRDLLKHALSERRPPPTTSRKSARRKTRERRLLRSLSQEVFSSWWKDKMKREREKIASQNLKVGDSILFPTKGPFSVGRVYEIWPDEERESESEVRVEFPAADGEYGGERMATLLALGDLIEEGDGVWQCSYAPRPYPPEPTIYRKRR